MKGLHSLTDLADTSVSFSKNIIYALHTAIELKLPTVRAQF